MIVPGSAFPSRGDPIEHINAFKQSELADVSGSVGDAVVVVVLGEIQEIGNECCVVRHWIQRGTGNVSLPGLPGGASRNRTADL